MLGVTIFGLILTPVFYWVLRCVVRGEACGKQRIAEVADAAFSPGLLPGEAREPAI
jgi:hypothetical protein